MQPFIRRYTVKEISWNLPDQIWILIEQFLPIGILYIKSFLKFIAIAKFAPEADTLQLAAVQFITVAVISGIATLISGKKCSWNNVMAGIRPLLYCGVVAIGFACTLQVVAQKYLQKHKRVDGFTELKQIVMIEKSKCTKIFFNGERENAAVVERIFQ